MIMMSVIRSFFNHYGILSISLITMTMFGNFGLRPSQTKYKCLACFLDIWLICSYTAVCVSSLLHLRELFSVYLSGFHRIFILYSTVYSIIIIITFTLWLVVTCKKYNIFYLIEDVVSIRRATLGKGNVFCMAATISIVGAVLIINGVSTMTAIDRNFSLLHIFLIVFQYIYVNITWMLMWNITFFIMCYCFNYFKRISEMFI